MWFKRGVVSRCSICNQEICKGVERKALKDEKCVCVCVCVSEVSLNDSDKPREEPL